MRRVYTLSAWRGSRQKDGTYRGGLREAALARDNYQCRMCGVILSGRKGELNAPEVDHIQPVETHPELALDLSNLQSLCTECHSRHKQRQDKGTLAPAIGADGWPIG